MAAAIQTWIDGAAATALPLSDRGLDYGDGLFETMPLIAGRVPWLSYHLDRLSNGLFRLGFPDETLGDAQRCIQSALGDGCPHDGVLRLTVTRGGGPRGYAPPGAPRPRCILQASAVDDVGQPGLPAARVLRCPVVLSRQPLLAGLKHLNRLEQVLAAAERQRAGVEEMLMTDTAGNAISVIAGNLFLVRDGRLLTPELTGCGILGTRRRLVLEELAPALGLDCQETTVSEGEVGSADEAFYCNSVRGYQAIGRYGDRRWHRHPILEALQALYRERLLSCAA